MTQDLRKRTKDFAFRVMRLYFSLPSSTVARVIGKQVLRSDISVGAYYREAYRSHSDAKLISKIIDVALQELEETIYWFELLVESDLVSEKKLANLL